MDPETIKAISQLWQLLGLFFLLIVILLFQKPLRNLLNNSKGLHVKRGDLEISVGSQEKDSNTNDLKRNENEPVAEKPPVRGEENNVEREPETPDEWRTRLIELFRKRDGEAFEKAYAMLQEKEKEPSEILRNQAIYHSFHFRMGHTSALEELKALTQKPEVSSIAYMYLGVCYREAGDFAKAAAAYDLAAHTADNDLAKAHSIANGASCLYQSGKKAEAFDRITNEIATQTEAATLAALYRGLASLYKMSEDKELQALALEKAIQNRPSDTYLRFDAAYLYSDSDIADVGLLHYKTILAFDPTDAGSLNNIGAQYRRLNLPCRAVQAYKKAVAEKNTLAASNLAFTFLEAGFSEEAKKLLDEAKEQPDFNPNVGRAFAAIAEHEEAEEKSEEIILNGAREQQRFLSSFADAAFFQRADQLDFVGTWLFVDGTEATIKKPTDELECLWMHKDKKFKFVGKPIKQASKIKFYKMDYYLFGDNKEAGYSQTGFGYAYLATSGQQLHIMKKEGNEWSFLELQRTAG